MKDYLFILGRDIELSLLELESYFLARDIEYKVKKQNENFLHLQLPNLKFKQVIKDLGGVSKILKLVKKLDEEPLYTGKKHRINYAVSRYDETDGTETHKYLKQRFKEEKLKAMLKKSHRKEPYLMPSEIIKNNILTQGFEIVMYNKKTWLTIACYNPKEYEKRDLKRPVQRPLHTMSLRLAKILINLTAAKPGKTILDPFCGIGTLLQEALLEGYNAIGVDKERDCIVSAQKNLNWLQKTYKIHNDVTLVHSSAVSLQDVKFVDAVATEPYLGPFLKKLPTQGKALQIVKELVPLYDSIMKSLAQKTRGRIVFMVPRFRLYDGKRITVPFEKIFKKHGLRTVRSKFGIKLPIIYTGQKSKIEREIWVLETFK